ncbi:MAG: ComF family protein [Gammaproteobacteria bacterium]|nr:ComF family protein [Gammaproteobacteria bacterium]
MLSTILSREFIRYLNETHSSADVLSLPQQLIPIPLHPQRLRERGFNQALEIALTLSRFSGIAVNNSLVYRTRYTPSQSQLNAEDRSTNLKRAFKLKEPTTSLNLKHLVIVDDVVTTMATGNAIAEVLKSAGVERVDFWAIARASFHP